MDGDIYYTRTFCGNSPRQLVSGNGPRTVALSYRELEFEFRKHSDRFQTTPTSLVSVSPRIVEAVKRAYDLQRQNIAQADDIWIVIIKVPSTAPQPHSAEKLAERYKYPDPVVHRYEFLFEGEIPEKFVVHKVSLQTLIERGLHWGIYFPEDPKKLLMYWQLKESVSETLKGPLGWTKKIDFVQLFGAQAPLDWLSNQFYEDCMGTCNKDIPLLEQDMISHKLLEKFRKFGFAT